MSISTIDNFLQELESHCITTAIATFLDSDEQVFVIDLIKKEKSVTYGYHPLAKKEFKKRLFSGSSPSAALVLRSFTKEIDDMTQLPIKELRGYALKREGEHLLFEKLKPEAMFACQNTDAVTGEPKPLEQAVRYC